MHKRPLLAYIPRSIFAAAILLTGYSMHAHAMPSASTTTLTPYQDAIPVATEYAEFEVLERSQAPLAALAKDAPQLKVERDFMGIKQMKNDMKFENIKQRFQDGLKELRTPQSELIKSKNYGYSE